MKIGCERKVFLNIICSISLMIAVKNGIPHTDPNARITVMLLPLRQKTKLTTQEGHNIITSQTFQLVPVALVETTQVRETRYYYYYLSSCPRILTPPPIVLPSMDGVQ